MKIATTMQRLSKAQKYTVKFFHEGGTDM